VKPVSTFPRIATDESLRETVTHGNTDYPFHCYLEDIWDFDLHRIDWHWHAEVEFFWVRCGTANVSIGSENIVVSQGCGMFINSQSPHRFTSETSTIIPNMVFSPALLAQQESLIYLHYVQPLLNCDLPYLLFDPQIPWQSDILENMKTIFQLNDSPQPNHLRTLRLLLTIWETMVEHTDLHRHAEEKPSAGRQARLQVMLRFIHDHYQEPLTLQSIADSVYISKSSALQVFHQGVQQSPITYLIHYRLKQAAQLLRSTEKSVSAIAAESGFSSAGYFCRKFRKHYSCTPNEYRKNRRKRTPE